MFSDSLPKMQEIISVDWATYLELDQKYVIALLEKTWVFLWPTPRAFTQNA
jgi:hypothetical protein